MSQQIAALIIEMLVKGTLVLAATWAIVTVARRLSSAERHLVWAAALGALLALPALSLLAPDVELPIEVLAVTPSRPPPPAADGPTGRVEPPIGVGAAGRGPGRSDGGRRAFAGRARGHGLPERRATRARLFRDRRLAHVAARGGAVGRRLARITGALRHARHEVCDPAPRASARQRRRSHPVDPRALQAGRRRAARVRALARRRAA